MRTFLMLWAGQTGSVFGSALTSFALSVWVYTTTGSVTQYALLSFFAMLPGLLMSPVIGALVDRWDRRWILIGSDLGSGLVTMAIAFLVFSDRLEVWHLYVLLTLSSCFNAFQFPAFSSSVTLLVKREDLGRAAGMSQLGPSVSMVLAPMLAPVLLVTIGLFGVMVIDAITFLFAVGTLLAVRIPRPPKSAATAEGTVEEQVPLMKDAAFGWTYIRKRPGLLGLLFLLAGGNLVLGFLQVLLVPIALERWSPHILGMILAAAAAGTVAGGLIMSVWRGPKRRIHWILALLLFQGLVLIVGAPAHSAFGLGVVVFIYMMQVPIIAALSQAIWQTTVEPDLQGRVFAVRRMMALIAKPLAFAAAGPLSDRVFEPLLMPDGPLASTAGALIGVGNGRGTALFAMGLGLLLALAVVRAYFYRPLRDLQTLEAEPAETEENGGDRDLGGIGPKLGGEGV